MTGHDTYASSPATDSGDGRSRESAPLVVVGIGASAGGLAALRTFFSHVPDRSGLAYVEVVHLSPGHESPMADLLQRTPRYRCSR